MIAMNASTVNGLHSSYKSKHAGRRLARPAGDGEIPDETIGITVYQRGDAPFTVLAGNVKPVR